MPARLIFLTGSRAGTSVVLPEGQASIGRGPDRFVRFAPDEILVSTDHASVVHREDGYVLIDHGSRNGTFVNRVRVTEHHLTSGDMIEFGQGGPSAQFRIADDFENTPTLDADRETVNDLLERARARVPTGSRALPGLSTTREFMVMAYHRSSRRTRRVVLASFGGVVVLLLTMVVLQRRAQGALQATLAELAVALETERGSRSLLEDDLSAIRSGYDSLLAEVEASRRQLEEATPAALARGNGAVTEITNRYAGGVALLVFSYGFYERDGSRLLRYQVDQTGRPLLVRLPDGRAFPRLGFDGAGPPVTRQGSATGFLVDSSGWLLTNRHVAEPWRYEEDLAFLQAPDANVEPRFLTLRAYFPPGDRSYPLRVFATSTVVDVASLRTDDRPIEAPVLPLAPRDVLVPPGEDVIFFGFPTGVHNLLFRLAEAERSEVLAAIGEEPVKLAREIARRRIVQPLVIAGTVSDTTSTEVIHTAGTTGGGSGGPLLNARGEVIGIHYAAVRSPIEGDPFQTQRGVPASFAWEVLPLAVRDRIEARASAGQR